MTHVIFAMIETNSQLATIKNEIYEYLKTNNIFMHRHDWNCINECAVGFFAMIYPRLNWRQDHENSTKKIIQNLAGPDQVIPSLNWSASQSPCRTCFRGSGLAVSEEVHGTWYIGLHAQEIPDPTYNVHCACTMHSVVDSRAIFHLKRAFTSDKTHSSKWRHRSCGLKAVYPENNQTFASDTIAEAITVEV